MPLETHGSVSMLSTYHGLEFVFFDWTLRDPLNTYNRFGVEAIEAFYEASDAKYGVDRGAPLFVLTRLAVALRDMGRLDEVVELIERYSDQIQAPPRALISVADRYRERGQTDRAAAVYQMVLDAGPRAQNEQDASALEMAANALQEFR
jgi:tetratricopeptide (TPR) repeat protein